jgi:hypothetical protein
VTSPGPVGRRPAAQAGVLLAVASADFLTLLPGWWWATAAVAFLAGAALRGAGRFLTAVAGALLGWTGMLLWRGAGHLGGVAGLVGALATGRAGEGWAAFAVTALTVVLLALAGGWSGGAVRRFVRSPGAGTVRAGAPVAADAPATADGTRVPSPAACGSEEGSGD